MKSELRMVELQFHEILNSDCMIVCEHFTLNNSINKYGVDFAEPMLFNKFLELIGKHLTPMNCKSLFKQARWYIYTSDSEETINQFFREV